MRSLFIPFLCGCLCSLGQAQNVPVFVSGTEGYRSFRIPAIIKTGNGYLLAFAEGRTGGPADYGNVDIVLKRSHDNGRTWSALQVVADNGTLQAGNPAPVADGLDPRFPGGRIFLFYNTGNNHEGEVAKGKGIRECYYITSTDGGMNWSAPVNITGQVHRPLLAADTPATRHPDKWRTYANTPGHALQIQEGPFRGRLYIPANHSAGEPRNGGLHYAAHAYYSDDHGESFRLAESVPIAGSNEATAAALPQGGLLLNARNQHGSPRCRVTCRSSDGGRTWDTCYYDTNLPDPVCEGSLLELGRTGGRYLLAFCNPADTARRNNLMLRISRDGGLSWYRQVLVESGAAKGDITAYSDLVRTGRYKIGVLYERNDYREIVFRNVSWKRSSKRNPVP